MYPLFYLNNISHLYFYQSLEWNEESAEEQGGAESPGIIDDLSLHGSDKKEENPVTVTEENEWDRLLRVR